MCVCVYIYTYIYIYIVLFGRPFFDPLRIGIMVQRLGDVGFRARA